MIRFYLDLLDYEFEELDPQWHTIDLEGPLIWKKQGKTWEVKEAPQDVKLMNFQSFFDDFNSHALQRLWNKDSDAKIGDAASSEDGEDEPSTSKTKPSTKNNKRKRTISNVVTTKKRPTRQRTPDTLGPEAEDTEDENNKDRNEDEEEEEEKDKEEGEVEKAGDGEGDGEQGKGGDAMEQDAEGEIAAGAIADN